MPNARPFDEAENTIIRDMRAAGHSWEIVAFRLGRSKADVLYHGRDIGVANRVVTLNDASPLHRHRALIERRCGHVSPADIADEINDRDPNAHATDDLVLQAVEQWGFARCALPAGHDITWSAIVAGTAAEGCAYAH